MMMSTGSTAVHTPKKKRNIAPYCFIAPWFLLFFAFSIFPIGFSLYVSLTEWNGFTQPVFVGIQNYVNAILDARFLKAVGNTFILMLMIIPPQIILGLLVALLLTNKLMVFRNGFRLMNFLPYLTTPIALGVIFGIMFDTNFGTINGILVQLGMQRIDWIGSEWPARSLVAMITVWKYFGYTAAMFMAGITKINPEHYEASEIDGANTFQSIWYIILPQLKPVTIFVILTTLIGCFQIFEEPFMIFYNVAARVLGGPNQSVLTGMWLFYDTAFSNQMRYGYAASISFCLFVIISVVTFVASKILNLGGDDK